MSNPPLKERDVARQIKDLLSATGWYVIRLQSGTMRGVHSNTFVKMGEPGMPDLLALKPAETLFIETKSPRGKLSAMQTVWHSWARKQGFRVLVAHGVEDVVNELKGA